MGFAEKSDLYNVFIDQSDFVVGEFVQQSINQRCRFSPFFLFLLLPSYVDVGTIVV